MGHGNLPIESNRFNRTVEILNLDHFHYKRLKDSIIEIRTSHQTSIDNVMFNDLKWKWSYDLLSVENHKVFSSWIKMVEYNAI